MNEEKALELGWPSEFPPQVARVKVAHYVVNYLDIAEIVVAVVYDLLQDRRTFTIDSGDKVRTAFGISETDILTRWSSIADSTLDNMTTANAHNSPPSQPIWGVMFDFMYARTGDLIVTRLIMRWLRQAMLDALADADFPVLFQFQLNVLDQWYDFQDTPFGDLFPFQDLMVLLNAIAAFRETVTRVLDFSFDDLLFREQIVPGVDLRVDGVVRIKLPEDGDDLLTWDLDGDWFSITFHFDEITMTADSEFVIIADAPLVDQLRFPFGGSLNDLRFLDVDVTFTMSPELTPAHAEPLGPYHLYRNVYFVDREGESLADVSIRVGVVDFDVEQTLLTSLLSAGGDYLDLVSSFDFDDLESLLEDAAESAIEGLDDFLGLAKTITDALVKFMPGALACSTQDYHKPYLNDHYAVKYKGLYAEAEDGALIILNDAPDEPEPAPSDDGPTYKPPGDIDIFWPGILDELGPGPDFGGGGRSSALSSVAQFDQVRIPAQYRPTYESRLAKRTNLRPDQEAAARLLIEGVDVRTIRFLNERQIDRAAGTVAGAPVTRETMAALERLRRSSGPAAGAFLFASGGAVMSPQQAFALAAGSLLPEVETLTFEPMYPSYYAEHSPLDARRGSATDPGWIGLSVNSYVIDKALSFLAGTGSFEATGQVTLEGKTYDYETVPSEKMRLFADLDGPVPMMTVNSVELTLSRQGGSVRYKVVGRAPLVAVRLSRGCLPDDSLLTVINSAGCIAGLTGGKFSGEVYRDELLYRHFVFVEPNGEAATMQSAELLSGNPDRFYDGLLGLSLLQAMALRDVWKQVGRVPVVFDPYYDLSPTVQAFDARDGWLNVYERYQLSIA